MPYEIVNETSADPVYRGDGKHMRGLDAEIERDRQNSRDTAHEERVMKWVQEVLGEKLVYANGNPATALKSGIVLCKLLNKIKPGTIKSINYQDISVAELGNIEGFLAGCSKLGVESHALFLSHDLYTQKDMKQVFVCLTALARVAQDLPSYKGPPFGPKRSNSAPAKKWAPVKTGHEPLLGNKKKKKKKTCGCCVIC